MQKQSSALLESGELAAAARMLLSCTPAAAASLRAELAAAMQEASDLETAFRRRELSVARHARLRADLAERLASLANAVPADLPRAEPAPIAGQPVPPRAARRRMRVFLSYNHADAALAASVREALRQRDVDVRVDVVDMKPGEQIRAFIAESIRSTDCTFCLISSASLLSAWVAQETLLALAAREFACERRFVAGYVDDDFLCSDFRLRATDVIDAHLSELNDIFSKHLARGLGTDDIDQQRARLLRLRGELGTILRELREGLSLDLRPAAFEASVERFVASLASG